MIERLASVLTAPAHALRLRQRVTPEGDGVRPTLRTARWLTRPQAQWTRCKPVWSGKKGRRSISANLKRSPQRSRRLAASRALMPVVPMVPSSMWRVSSLDKGPHCHNIFPDRISVKRFAARYGTAIRTAAGQVCSTPNAGPSWRRVPLLSDPSNPTAGPAALDRLRRQYTRAPKHPSPLNPARDSAPSEYVPPQPARPPSGAIS